MLQTYRQSHRRTPGEYNANFSPAWLVPGPELINNSGSPQKVLEPELSNIYAKFQLTRLIFTFINCYQLLGRKIKLVSHLIPKFDICAKFELCRLLGGPARECDRQTDARQTDPR